MRSPNSALTVGQALALGALQGPTELLPISSSAHTAALAWLLGWRYGELEPETRKSFEVALHGGGTVALLLATRRELAQAIRELDRRRMLVLGAACAAPVIAGFALESEIERNLGTPRTIAAALLAGSLVMAVADRFPEQRECADADVRDGLWMGLAQACALIPGVSRAGATLAGARIRRFRATDAKLLSEQVAVPVLVGAALLKGAELRRRGLDSAMAVRFAAGGGAAFLSTMLVASGLGRRRTPRRLLPYAIYRALLGSWMLVRLRRG